MVNGPLMLLVTAPKVSWPAPDFKRPVDATELLSVRLLESVCTCNGTVAVTEFGKVIAPLADRSQPPLMPRLPLPSAALLPTVNVPELKVVPPPKLFPVLIVTAPLPLI